ELLRSARTTAVFQLESRGMKDLIRRLQPDSFEDIIALVALFRPGPLQSGMVDDFIDRKHGRSRVPIDYLHPRLEPILRPTYGVILYQEQVMQIAQVLAGYSLGGADLLRRAMGKKKPEEMAKQRDVFVAGAVANGVPRDRAAYIFDLMEKFAGYGFNKSHSAAYALLSYQTAWLKAHYPAAFMAAVLSADLAQSDKVVTIKDECDRMGLKILPPDVNMSQYDFTAVDAQTIRFGLGAVKGVGQAAVAAIVEEREYRGPFRSLADLCRRLDKQRLNQRVFEALIRSGALDALGANRATLMAQLPAAMQLVEQSSRAVEAGQVDLFGLAETVATRVASGSADTVQPEWGASDLLAGERETLGLYLSGHPLDRYERDLRYLVSARIGDLQSERPAPAAPGERGFAALRSVQIAGYIHEVRRRAQRVSAVLDDRTGRIEVVFSDEIFQQYRELIVKDALVLVDGSLRFDEFADGWRLQARRVVDLDRLREQQAQRLLLVWPRSAPVDLPARLAKLLESRRGGRCSVSVRYRVAQGCADLDFGVEWQVRPDRALLDALDELFGRDGVRLVFAVRSDQSQSALG
ncbi:MAG: DNA polymerase III subunit alpha, partial [Steroidobacteraceae bacterium]|nr:DNA polymerase III subunit alpha [Steroidobacteraceae bacterium]MDW8260464.1 DNA polymerase III subunit alpha [Gammaproteobacteria bacterium]